MGADFQDAFCGVSFARAGTQVREVICLVFRCVYHKLSMLIACGIHAVHSIAPCDLVGYCYHANIIVLGLYREYAFLSLCHLCVCVCAWVFCGFRSLLFELLVSPTYLFRDEEAVRSQVRSGQGISVSKSFCSAFHCQHAKPHHLQWSSLSRRGLQCSFV